MTEKYVEKAQETAEETTVPTPIRLGLAIGGFLCDTSTTCY